MLFKNHEVHFTCTLLLVKDVSKYMHALFIKHRQVLLRPGQANNNT